MSKSESCASRSGQPTTVPQTVFGSPKAKSQTRHYIEILVHVSERECVVLTISYVHYILRIFIFGSFSPQVGWLVCVCLNVHPFFLLSWREYSAAAVSSHGVHTYLAEKLHFVGMVATPMRAASITFMQVSESSRSEEGVRRCVMCRRQ